MEVEWGSGFFDLTRFLDANRYPLRWKTVQGQENASKQMIG
jgi:hypothetical protein